MNREQPTGGLLRTRWDRDLLRMIAFSLGLHVLVVAVLVMIRPWSRERSAPPPPAYTVELTSLSSLGSNVVPGAPGDRLTGGRAEPRPPVARPPAPAADMKRGTEVAKIPAPPAERAPVKPPPPPVPKAEPPPAVASEPVRLPEPPKTPPPEAPKPEPPKQVAKAPAPPPAATPSPERSEVPAAAVDVKPEVPKKPEAPAEKPPVATPTPEQPTQAAKLPAEAPKPAEKPKAAEKPKPDEAPKKPADEAKIPAPQRATADATKPAATPEKPSAPGAETKKTPPQTAEQPAQAGAPSAGPVAQDGAAPDQDTRYAAAIDRVRRRLETGAGGLMGDGDARQAPSIGGTGPGGGNQVVGAEFLIYYNIMLSHIKRSWLWVGHDDTLSVTVHFRIGPEGEIGDVRLERPSGDATYDESVLRAVREASPLPPPPAAHRRDFGDVRLTFRPGDLRQPG